jgi:hypothetical protein
VCNTYCFSTATVVTRTLLNFTFIRALSVFVILVCNLCLGPPSCSPLQYYRVSFIAITYLGRSHSIWLVPSPLECLVCPSHSCFSTLFLLAIFITCSFLTYFVHPVWRDLFILTIGDQYSILSSVLCFLLVPSYFLFLPLHLCSDSLRAGRSGDRIPLGGG